MIYNDAALDLFCNKYAKDLILCCYGNEAENYAEDFEFKEFHIKKYHNNILANKEHIENKKILEIGSNSGLWAILMLLNGATHVTCVEPRPQLCKGLTQFCELHNFPITVINSTHKYIYTTTERFDTTLLMGVDDLIPDIMSFLNTLCNVSNRLILKTKNHNDIVQDNCAKLNLENNLALRDGININTDISKLSDYGEQTTIEDFVNNPSLGRFVRYYYGKNYFDTLFDYLECKVENFYMYNNEALSLDPKDDTFKVYSVNLRQQV